MIKATLKDTQTKLAECKQKRKELAAALKNCEDARAVLGQKLKACLEAKAKLTEAVKNCHENLRNTREKLQLCLRNKAELNEKIRRCHEARDRAQAKWDECERQKKTMNEAIARLRAELTSAGGSGSAALLQKHAEKKRAELVRHEARLKQVEDDYAEAALDLEEYEATL